MDALPGTLAYQEKAAVRHVFQPTIYHPGSTKPAGQPARQTIAAVSFEQRNPSENFSADPAGEGNAAQLTPPRINRVDESGDQE
jgi:hypothetical protein